MVLKKGRNTRIIIIVASAFFIRVLISCCDCANMLTYFDYSKLQIESMDNSGARLIQGNDTLKSEAVAFKVEISGNDSLIYSTNNVGFGFEQTTAFTCDCSIPFKSNQTVDSIKIQTIYTISDQILAGTDVTHLFLGNLAVNSSESKGLYTTLDKIIEDVNSTVLFDSQTYVFYLFLKQKIETDKAGFIIKIYFSDKTVLTQFTPIVTII